MITDEYGGESMTHVIEALERALAQARRERDACAAWGEAMREALIEYGGADECEPPCTCGYMAALALDPPAALARLRADWRREVLLEAADETERMMDIERDAGDRVGWAALLVATGRLRARAKESGSTD